RYDRPAKLRASSSVGGRRHRAGLSCVGCCPGAPNRADRGTGPGAGLSNCEPFDSWQLRRACVWDHRLDRLAIAKEIRQELRRADFQSARRARITNPSYAPESDGVFADVAWPGVGRLLCHDAVPRGAARDGTGARLDADRGPAGVALVSLPTSALASARSGVVRDGPRAT